MNKSFNVRAARAIADPNLKKALHQATNRFSELRQKGFASVPAPLALRARAREIRRRTFDELDRHLEILFKNLERVGTQVHFATDANAANEAVLDIARRHGAKSAVKSKSMASEEIHLNDFLEKAGVTTIETDLGEYIIQLAGETPSHLIAPAIHKTRVQVAELFAEKLGADPTADAEALAALARAKLHDDFLGADLGISGVNFAIAETGTLCIVTNEGNGRLVTTLPKVHIAIMGFEKLVPTVEEAFTLLSVLPRSGTGQKITSYFTMLNGPRASGEADGPDEVHLVLLDGGRSRHLGGPFQEAFHCIRCGACLNACPVFQTVGGHTYDSVYGGPIGSILSPMLRGLDVSGELPAASSLCGACMEVCPVLVDIPRMLIEMREAKIDQKKVPFGERFAFQAAALTMRSPLLWQACGRALPWLLWPFTREGKVRWLPGPLGAWAKGREIPSPARKSFRARWRERARAGGNHGRKTAISLGGTKGAAGAQDAGDLVAHTRRALELGEGLSHGHAEAPAGPLPEVVVEDPMARFAAELEACGGKAFRAETEEEAKSQILEMTNAWKGKPVAVSQDLPLPAAEWLEEAGFEVIRPVGENDDRDRIKRAGVGLTGCDWAIAETGTLVLLSGPGRPRLYSLLPEVHIAIVQEEQILPHLSAAAPPLKKALRQARGKRISCANLITGPSRTADIELTLIQGVHGPREVRAILLPAGFPVS